MANIEENWYTEEHIHAETSWNKMQDEFVNVRALDSGERALKS